MINLALARVSNDLLVVAVIAYSLAMLGYGAEFSFARRTANALAGVAERVGAGVGAVGGPVSLDKAPAVGAVGVTGASETGSGRGEVSRGERLGRLAVSLTLFGWAAHAGSVVTRGLAAHRTPWGNMYEFSCAITLAAVTVFLGSLIRHKLRYLGAFVMLPVVVTLGIAGTLLYSKAEPLQPALQSYWLKIHVTAAIVAWGVFMVGAVQTVLYLLQERRERTLVVAWATAVAADASSTGLVSGALGSGALDGGALDGGAQASSSVGATGRAGSHRSQGSRPGQVGRLNSVLERLPSAEALDGAAYKTIAFGFPIWTFAIICGSIWAEKAWGRYWGWDPKETWSFITWVIYAGYLHARATAGWRGRKAAVVAMAAFAALTIDYYVVNIVVSGLHSYAGL